MDDLDFANRRLCPDGACIGVIGKDGRCKECGRKDPGAKDRALAGEPEAEERDEVEAADEAEAEAEAEATDEDEESETEDEEGGAPDWGDRRLCPDGACIGVIGSDGKCGECG